MFIVDCHCSSLSSFLFLLAWRSLPSALIRALRSKICKLSTLFGKSALQKQHPSQRRPTYVWSVLSSLSSLLTSSMSITLSFTFSNRLSVAKLSPLACQSFFLYVRDVTLSYVTCTWCDLQGPGCHYGGGGGNFSKVKRLLQIWIRTQKGFI